MDYVHHDPTATLGDTGITRGQFVEMLDGAIAQFIGDATALSRAWHASREPSVIVSGALVGSHTLAALIHAAADLAAHDAQQDAIQDAVETIGFTVPDSVEVTE